LIKRSIRRPLANPETGAGKPEAEELASTFGPERPIFGSTVDMDEHPRAQSGVTNRQFAAQEIEDLVLCVAVGALEMTGLVFDELAGWNPVRSC
jgi:hypothetical protein